MVYEGETFEFELQGVAFVATVERDECTGAPWKEHDGHGEVTEWEYRAKLPGELVLNEDRGAYRFYDFRAACKTALKEGWRAPECDGTGTARQIAAKAARADFEHLKAWCDDDWFWCTVTVRRADACEGCGDSETLGGVESSSETYVRDVAKELASELI